MLANSKLKSKLEKALQIKLCLANVNKYVEKPFSYLKPKQVDSTYLGIDNDLLCVLPTGYGKTALFNTIPMYSKIVRECKTTIIVVVISPLNAIIADQKKMFGDRAIVMAGKIEYIA
jgi:superfamily II DNA helicase RecQ